MARLRPSFEWFHHLRFKVLSEWNPSSEQFSKITRHEMEHVHRPRCVCMRYDSASKSVAARIIGTVIFSNRMSSSNWSCSISDLLFMTATSNAAFRSTVLSQIWLTTACQLVMRTTLTQHQSTCRCFRNVRMMYDRRGPLKNPDRSITGFQQGLRRVGCGDGCGAAFLGR